MRHSNYPHIGDFVIGGGRIKIIKKKENKVCVEYTRYNSHQWYTLSRLRPATGEAAWKVG
jgi:hypothetical protein